jgi:hypothetical protein
MPSWSLQILALTSCLLWCVNASAVASDIRPASPSPAIRPPPISDDQMETVYFPGAMGVRLQPPAPVGTRPAGQWVYTLQQGWLYMPFETAFVRRPISPGGDPMMYAYYANYGWHWVAAPWVFGIGPRPWFGVYGPFRFPWYGHGAFGRRWFAFQDGHPAWYHEGLPWTATQPPVHHAENDDSAPPPIVRLPW